MGAWSYVRPDLQGHRQERRQHDPARPVHRMRQHRLLQGQVQEASEQVQVQEAEMQEVQEGPDLLRYQPRELRVRRRRQEVRQRPEIGLIPSKLGYWVRYLLPGYFIVYRERTIFFEKYTSVVYLIFSCFHP